MLRPRKRSWPKKYCENPLKTGTNDENITTRKKIRILFEFDKAAKVAIAIKIHSPHLVKHARRLRAGYELIALVNSPQIAKTPNTAQRIQGKRRQKSRNVSERCVKNQLAIIDTAKTSERAGEMGSEITSPKRHLKDKRSKKSAFT